MSNTAARLIRIAFCLAALFFIAPLPQLATQDKTPAHQGLGALKPWTSDFDGMQQRRVIRFLVPYSKTIYFLDKGRQYGTAVERGRAFQSTVNKGRKKASQQITVVYVPMPRDQLFPALAQGLGDIVAASLTVTKGRLNDVDFSAPRSGIVGGENEQHAVALVDARIATV